MIPNSAQLSFELKRLWLNSALIKCMWHALLLYGTHAVDPVSHNLYQIISHADFIG